MKLVKNRLPNVPANRIEFHVSMGMSVVDVKNYLEKIYNVPVVSVKNVICQGEMKKAPGKNYIIKDDDYKKAYVTLPADYKFEFPDVFPREKVDKEMAEEDKVRAELETKYVSSTERNKVRPIVLKWFV